MFETSHKNKKQPSLMGRSHDLSIMLSRISNSGKVDTSDQLDLSTLAHLLANYDIASMHELKEVLKKNRDIKVLKKCRRCLTNVKRTYEDHDFVCVSCQNNFNDKNEQKEGLE